MGQPPPRGYQPTQRIEPAYFRSDPHQPTVMLDVGLYLGRAAGTTPPVPRPPGRRVALTLLLTMLAMTAVAFASRATYWFLVETDTGRAWLERLLAIIAAPL